MKRGGRGSRRGAVGARETSRWRGPGRVGESRGRWRGGRRVETGRDVTGHERRGAWGHHAVVTRPDQETKWTLPARGAHLGQLWDFTLNLDDFGGTPMPGLRRRRIPRLGLMLRPRQGLP